MNKPTCIKALEESKLQLSEINRLYKISQKAASLGGEVLMQNFGRIKDIKSKGTAGDIVTNADLAAEKLIIHYLESETPEISILAEESGLSGASNSLQWCIDPLDGTTNFASNYPFFATSIGLTWNDLPLLGSISIPFFKEIYSAAPGIGAFCNGKKIQVSSCEKLVDSLLVTGFAYDRKEVLDNNYGEFIWLTHLTRGVRRGGAAAVDLAFISCGRLDGYWERGLKKWDLAAGVPLVELAGGVVSNYYKGDFQLSNGRILASNKGIADELKNELSKIKPIDPKKCIN